MFEVFEVILFTFLDFFIFMSGQSHRGHCAIEPAGKISLALRKT